MFPFFSQTQSLNEIVEGLYVTSSDAAINERVLKNFSIKHVITLNTCLIKDSNRKKIESKPKGNKSSQQKIHDKLNIRHIVITNTINDPFISKDNLWISQFHNAYQEVLTISPNDKNRCIICSDFRIEVVHAFIAYFLCKKFNMTYQQSVLHLKKNISKLAIPVSVIKYLEKHNDNHDNGTLENHLESGHAKVLRSALRKTNALELKKPTKKTVRFAEELVHKKKIDFAPSHTFNDIKKYDIKKYDIKNEQKLKRTIGYISLPHLGHDMHETDESLDDVFEDLMTGSSSFRKNTNQSNKIKVARKDTINRPDQS